MKNIQELNKETFTQIYHQHLVNDFPINEQRPLDMMLDLMQKGQYIALGYYENEILIGYATIYYAKNIYLLDYFAIVKDYRAEGYGSSFLTSILKHYQNEALLLEVENPNIDPSPQKSRRMAFYLRQEIIPLHINLYLYYVDYVLLGTKPLTLKEVQDFYLEIYPEPWYSKYIHMENDTAI